MGDVHVRGRDPRRSDRARGPHAAPDPDNGPDGDPTGETLVYGYVSLLDDQCVPAPGLSGGFLAASDRATFEEYLRPGTTGSDACTVTRFDSTPPPSVPRPPTPDAGEVLTVSSPGGTYATLFRRREMDRTATVPSYTYEIAADASLTRPVPSGLTLDVPGGESVPALTALAFPDVQPLELLDPLPARDIRVDVDTAYRWVPGPEPLASVEIGLLGRESYVECSARDDGESALPPATVAEAGRRFVGTFARIVRVVSTIASPGPTRPSG